MVTVPVAVVLVRLCAVSVKVVNEGPQAEKVDGLAVRLTPALLVETVKTTVLVYGGAHLKERPTLPLPPCANVMVTGFVDQSTFGVLVDELVVDAMTEA